MKKLILFYLSVALLLSMPGTTALGAGESFVPVRSYQSGRFTDVGSGDWFAADVRAVYELGLMNGASADTFDPSGSVTVTQAIALASRMHSIYNTGEDSFLQGRIWYDVYVRYALEHGIISTRFNCKRVATRAEVADILSRALPASALAPINTVYDNAIPDVKKGDEYAQGIYLLYRAGVTVGSDSRGTFDPQSHISRAELAAMVTRMADTQARKRVTLDYLGPDLSEQPEASDSFFADAAILGNSLVDGLRAYGKLSTAHFFCGTSVSVISATQTADTTLAGGGKGTLVQALTQAQYGKIYIELGINEVGYDKTAFIKMYGDMIDDIASREPNAEIYIMSILPVTKSMSTGSRVFNMEHVNAFNAALRELAAEKRCWYMDVCSALQGADGYLPADWSADGVHLYPANYAAWETYIRTHYVQ